MTVDRPKRWLIPIVLGIGLIVPTGAWAEEQEAPVEMSAYEVMAHSVKFRNWKKLSSPNFTVYTDARSRRVRGLVREMEMMHLAAQVILGRRPLHHEPVRVILPNSWSDWRKLRSRGEVQWQVAVSSLSSFSPTCLVEYNWNEDGAKIMWASLGKIEMDLLGLNTSFAFSRGIGSFFETVRPVSGGLRIGIPNRRMTAVIDYGFYDWSRFFTFNGLSPEFTRDGNAVHRIDGQAAVFVHYWMMQDESRRIDRLFDWNARLLAGAEPTSDLFCKVFEMDFFIWQEEAFNYVRQKGFPAIDYAIAPGALDFVVTELDVKTAEMRELFTLAQILNQKVEASEEALDTLLKRGLATSDLMPMLVGACLEWERYEAAESLLGEMINEGDEAAKTHAEYARLAFRRIVEMPTPSSRLSEEEYHELASRFVSALAREPIRSGVNARWAWVVALREDLSASDLDELRRVCRRMDGNGDTDDPLAALAFASWRMGDTNTAERLHRLLEESPYTDKGVHAFLEEFRKVRDQG